MSELPNAFISSISEVFDSENLDLFLLAMTTGDLPVSVRLNPSKPSSHFDTTDHVPWSTNAFYLQERPTFTIDPYFHGGCYYVQEASSMLLEHTVKQLIDIDEDLLVLDLCAAPGGKSTHLLDILSKGSLLVSNEMVRQRFNSLDQNLGKWGRSNIIRTATSASRLSQTGLQFDLIVVDAPCSGEGMMRKDPQAIAHWSPENVQICHMRQKDILISALEILKPNGILVYTTCTFNAVENESIGDWLVEECDMLPQSLRFNPSWGISLRHGKATKAYVAYPHLVRGEGLCIQAFQKEGSGRISTLANTSKPNDYKNNSDFSLEQICAESESLLIMEGNKIVTFNKSYWKEFSAIHSKISGALPGRRVGEIKGKVLIPDHELAMYPDIWDKHPVVHLDVVDALSYLRGESLPNKTALQKGWALASYQDIPIGWIKALPNRLNNYYPKSNRIKHL